MKAPKRQGPVSIGIRQLKAELSRQLRRVEAGETLQVTDRGRVIATIQPVDPPAESPTVSVIRRLVAEGKVTWSGQKPAGSLRPARLRGRATVSDAVIEDRR